MNPLRLTAAGRRSLRLLAWAVLPVSVLAGYVQLTGVGIDILLVAVAGLALLTLERSVGDWLGEWMGPFAAAAILTAVAVAFSWYFLADSMGRPKTDRFFAEAERRGYRTVYYQRVRSSEDEPAPALGSPDSGKPVATGGARPSTAREATAAPPQAPSARESDPSASAERRDTPRGQPQEGRVTRSVRALFQRRPSELLPTEVALTVSPGRVEVARRVVIRAAVRSGGSPVASGTVEFTVNGLGAGRIYVDADGVASTTYLTYIPGTYDVRARYSGSGQYASSRSDAAVVNVVAK